MYYAPIKLLLCLQLMKDTNVGISAWLQSISKGVCCIRHLCIINCVLCDSALVQQPPSLDLASVDLITVGIPQ